MPLLGRLLVRAVNGGKPAAAGLGLPLRPDLGGLVRIGSVRIDEIKSLGRGDGCAALLGHLFGTRGVVDVDRVLIVFLVCLAQFDLQLVAVVFELEFPSFHRDLVDEHGLRVQLQLAHLVKMRAERDPGLPEQMALPIVETYLQPGVDQVIYLFPLRPVLGVDGRSFNDFLCLYYHGSQKEEPEHK